MSKGIKRILREILFRPINIILEPLFCLNYFISWFLSSDESWDGKTSYYALVGGSKREDELELFWWRL